MSSQLFLLGHAALVGLAGYVVLIAFRSYRKYDDPVLGWIFLGFLFLAVGTGLEGLLEHGIGAADRHVEVVELVSMALGFACVVHAVRG